MNQSRKSNDAVLASLPLRKYFNVCAFSVCLILIGYVVLYVCLSVRGQYQPASVGINHVEQYEWAPFGFYDPNHPWKGSLAGISSKTNVFGGWNIPLTKLFLPLYEFDHSYIHKCKQ
jgi:hypothetical protein